MAKAYKCDRCGQFYEEDDKRVSEKIKVVQGESFENGGFYPRHEWNFDLCNSCFHLLGEFLNTSFTEGGGKCLSK